MKLTTIHAEWRKLLFINYIIEPDVLAPYLPFHTKPALWDDKCYVSLVGFLFQKVRMAGIPFPGHTHFIEINLRFYVRSQFKNEWRHGVVFIREFVSLPIVTFIAKRIARENYQTIPVRHTIQENADDLFVNYSMEKSGWHSFEAHCQPVLQLPEENSPEDFLMMQHWGYTKVNEQKTHEYYVEHPPWKIYPLKKYSVQVDFGEVYGPQFSFLSKQEPALVFFAEGSPIIMRKIETLRAD